MTDKEVMQMALETLDNMVKVDWREWDEFASVEDFVRWAKSRASFTAEALRTALAQPEPEPVAWIKKDRSSIEVSIMSAEYMKNAGFEPLYTAPPQREWQGLAKEELQEIAEFHFHGALSGREFYDDIEAKLKEKNT